MSQERRLFAPAAPMIETDLTTTKTIGAGQTLQSCSPTRRAGGEQASLAMTWATSLRRQKDQPADAAMASDAGNEAASDAHTVVAHVPRVAVMLTRAAKASEEEKQRVEAAYFHPPFRAPPRLRAQKCAPWLPCTWPRVLLPRAPAARHYRLWCRRIFPPHLLPL